MIFNWFLKKFGIGDQMRYNLVRYTFNTGWMFAEKILLMVVAFFVGIYVARYLGPEKYGLLNYAISFVAIFKVMAGLGLDGIIIRELVQSRGAKKSILGSSFILKTIGACISFSIILIFVYFNSNDLRTSCLILIIASGLFFNSMSISALYFESIVKAKFNAIAISLSTLLSSCIKLFLVFYKADLLWFALSYVSDTIFQSVIVFLIYINKNNDLLSWKFEKKIAIKLIKESWPLLFSGVSVMIYLQIDQVMIKYMINADAVGKYSAAVKLSEMWYFIPAVITNSLFPAIVKVHESKNKYELRLIQLFRLLGWSAVLLAIPISLLSPWMIHNSFGQAYNESIPVLKIHIWSGIFIFMNFVISKWHIVENRTISFMLRTFSGALINIILNLILIPKYGINGAAIASLISYAYVGFISGLFFKPMRKLLYLQCLAIFTLKKTF
jgi:O-antigen/teichoic acid export membrane protein